VICLTKRFILMMKFLAMHAISLCWEYGTMNLLFWEITKIIIKCGRQICWHLYCLFRLQMDPKQSPRHECFKLSYRVIDKCKRGWTKNRKVKVASLKFRHYGHYWNNVWWMWWFKWSCERPIPHMYWINTVPIYDIIWQMAWIKICS
jgi:hypothetical protein